LTVKTSSRKLTLVIAVLAVGGAVSSWATPANKKAAANYFDHFLPAALADCTLCHLPSTNHAPESLEEFPHNAFGKELAAIKKKSLPERLKQLAGKDSDADGVANLTEILLGGHPGDAKVKPESLAQLDAKKDAFDRFLARYAWEPFKPVKRPASPMPGVANPIDAFIGEQLQTHALKPLGEATPAQISRRVYVDLIGLLPTPEQVTAFEKAYAAQPDVALHQLTDRLMDDPRYGERWGRHFMDIWRYSDWEGYKGAVRLSQPHIWRWRDWIIESLNANKPYDRMVQEMLAGDELAPTDENTLRATGYLARNFQSDRLQWMDNIVEHTSKAFMGLTMNCVKCHDHKYDPIPQTDYYAIRAVFEPYNVRTDPVPGELDAKKDGMPRAYDSSLTAVTYLFQRGDERFPIKDKPIAPGVPAIFDGKLDIKPVSLPLIAQQPEKRDYYKAAMLAAVESVADAELREMKRATLEQQLKLEALEDGGMDKKSADWKALAMKVAELQKQTALIEVREAKEKADAALQKAMATKPLTTTVKKTIATAKTAADAAKKKLAEAEKAIKTAAKAADYKPREVKSYPATSSGRRLAFARWLTSPQNTLFARVAANHLWIRHFGTGIVATPDDFGANGKKPTHPALLDWLAAEFTACGYDLKHMHRLIISSALYRRSSGSGEAGANDATDPDNVWYWRSPVRRLEGEAVRDNLLHVAGLLDPTFGGPEIESEAAEAGRRRSVYYRHAQETQAEMVQIFDGARPNECYQRELSIKPHQALALANSQVTLDAAMALEKRLSREAGADYAAFVTSAFEHVLNRRPKSEELRLSAEFIQQAGKDATRLRQHFIGVLFNHNDFITLR
jgi:cytochrome c553